MANEAFRNHRSKVIPSIIDHSSQKTEWDTLRLCLRDANPRLVKDSLIRLRDLFGGQEPGSKKIVATFRGRGGRSSKEFQRILADVIELLSHSDEDVRLQASWVASRIARCGFDITGAIERLTAMLRESAILIRRNSGEALKLAARMKLDLSGSTEALGMAFSVEFEYRKDDIADLFDAYRENQANYALALLALGENRVDISSAVPFLENHPYNHGQEALTQHFINTRQWGRILELLQNADSFVREGAEEILGKAMERNPKLRVPLEIIGKQAISRDPRIREKAAKSLYSLSFKSGVASAMDALLNLLQDKNPDIRWRAAVALGNSAGSKAGISRAVPALQSIVAGSNGSVRDSAIEALFHHFRRKGGWEELRLLMVHQSGDVRQKMAFLLGSALASDRPRGSLAPLIPALIALLKDQEKFLVAAACSALQDAVKHGYEVSSALPDLVELTYVKDYPIRPKAGELLAMIVTRQPPCATEFLRIIAGRDPSRLPLRIRDLAEELRKNGSFEKLQVRLPEKGARLDVSLKVMSSSPTVFESAIRNGSEKIVGAILERGAELEKGFPESGLTPLCAALRSGKEAIATLLLKHKAKADQACGSRETTFPLLEAAKANLPSAVRALIRHGALDSLSASDKSRLLFEAAKNGLSTLLASIVSLGADLSSTDQDGNTPLHLAVLGGKSVVKSLLDAGAGTDPPNGLEETPLHIAAEKGSPETIRALFKRKPDCRSPNLDGENPLHILMNRVNRFPEPVAVSLVRGFLKCGADYRKPDRWNQSPFEKAIHFQYFRVAGIFACTPSEKALLKEHIRSFRDLPTRKREVEEKGLPCPNCGAHGLENTGSRVDHGNPDSPASDTEVTHFFACRGCGLFLSCASSFDPIHRMVFSGNGQVFTWDNVYYRWEKRDS